MRVLPALVANRRARPQRQSLPKPALVLRPPYGCTRARWCPPPCCPPRTETCPPSLRNSPQRRSAAHPLLRTVVGASAGGVHPAADDAVHEQLVGHSKVQHLR